MHNELREQARSNRVICMRRNLLESLKQMEGPEMAVECQQRQFAYTYVDNETMLTEEEEKKIAKVARTKDSLPFGMHIKKAAHKATFG